MDFELNRLLEYSDESLLKEINRVANLIQHNPLTQKEFNKKSKVNSCTIVRRFGSWEKSLARAGLSARYSGQIVADKEKLNRGKGATKQDLIEELRRVAAQLNKSVITRKDLRAHSKYGSDLFNKRFGSLKKATESAGLQLSKHAPRYSDAVSFDNLLNVWTYYGRQPTVSEMRRAPSTVGPDKYLRRWGSWRKALLAFIEQVNSDLKIEKKAEAKRTEDINIIRDTKITENESNRREIRLGLRYEILKRDNFKCAICGDSPAITVGCKLEVDHVVPWSKGGLTVESNLRTLCNKCNNGKGNKLD